MSIAVPFLPDSTFPRSYVLTQPFHAGPVSYNPSPHLALDMAGYLEQPIYATESGKVFAASWNADGYAIGGGWCAIIEHYGPTDRVSRSLYAHTLRLVVSKGQYVLRGQLIGYADTTGNATGPHCHFAYALMDGVKWDWQDPYRYMNAHVYQNGSALTGDEATSAYTRSSLIVGIDKEGDDRPTNLRDKPYLTADVTRIATGKTLMCYLDTVMGSLYNGTRRWDKMWDAQSDSVVYSHTSVTLRVE